MLSPHSCPHHHETESPVCTIMGRNPLVGIIMGRTSSRLHHGTGKLRGVLSKAVRDGRALSASRWYGRGVMCHPAPCPDEGPYVVPEAREPSVPPRSRGECSFFVIMATMALFLLMLLQIVSFRPKTLHRRAAFHPHFCQQRG